MFSWGFHTYMLTINKAGSVLKTSDTWLKYRYLPPTRKYRQYRYLVSVSCPSLLAGRPFKTILWSRYVGINNLLIKACIDCLEGKCWIMSPSLLKILKPYSRIWGLYREGLYHGSQAEKLTNYGYLNFTSKLFTCVTRNMCVTDHEEYFFKITFLKWNDFIIERKWNDFIMHPRISLLLLVRKISLLIHLIGCSFTSPVKCQKLKIFNEYKGWTNFFSSNNGMENGLGIMGAWH